MPQRGCSRLAAVAVRSLTRWRRMATNSLGSTPHAPEGPMFLQLSLEAVEGEELFDGAVASLALHHVQDIDVALDKVHSLLHAGAPLVLREFAWDLVDEPTARWDYQRLGRVGGLAEWRAEHKDFHTMEVMRAGLDARSVSGVSSGLRISRSTSRPKATPSRSVV